MDSDVFCESALLHSEPSETGVKALTRLRLLRLRRSTFDAQIKMLVRSLEEEMSSKEEACKHRWAVIKICKASSVSARSDLQLRANVRELSCGALWHAELAGTGYTLRQEVKVRAPPTPRVCATCARDTQE